MIKISVEEIRKFVGGEGPEEAMYQLLIMIRDKELEGTLPTEKEFWRSDPLQEIKKFPELRPLALKLAVWVRELKLQEKEELEKSLR